MLLPPTAAAVVLDAVRFGVHVHLVRPDAPGDDSRFYQLLWQPGLWGEGALVEVCGRGGRPGAMHLTRYPDRDHAQPRVVGLLLRLVRQGYRVVDWQ